MRGVWALGLATHFCMVKNFARGKKKKEAQNNYLTFLWKETPLPNNISPFPLPNHSPITPTLVSTGEVKFSSVLSIYCFYSFCVDFMHFHDFCV